MFKKAALALIVSGLSVTATASPFFIDTGVSISGLGSPSDPADADSRTAVINELGYSGTLATSFYFGDPSVGGTAVRDTNIKSVMTGLGFSAGSFTAIDTVTPVSFLPGAVLGADGPAGTNALLSQYNIDSLNSITGRQRTEGFDPQAVTGGDGWGIFYLYDISGAVNASVTGVDYTSGFFDVYTYRNDAGGTPDLAAATQVAKVLVTGSLLQAANLNLFGQVDYAFCEPVCSTLTKNFFNDASTGESFYNIWKSTVPPPTINFVLDTNVNPPIPTPNQLVALNAGLGPLARQTTLDGSVTFSVPEPATLSLLGLGLLGAGVARRKKNAA